MERLAVMWMVPMGLTFALIAVALMASIGLAVVFWGWLRARRMRKLVGLATDLSGAGDVRGALNALAGADSLWGLGGGDGSRKRALREIGELDDVWREITRACIALNMAVDTSAVLGDIEALRALFEREGNFRTDGRSMKRPAAAEFADLMRGLDAHRKAAIRPVVEGLDER